MGLGEETQDSKPQLTFVKYYRQVFSQSNASTPMKREYLTLATCLDLMLEGNVLKCLDVGVQRMKAVEQISQAVAANIANRLELIPPEVSALVSTEESRSAVVEFRREEKVRSSLKGKKGKENWDGWEPPLVKGEKGGKPKGGKDPKGKGWGNNPHAKRAPVQESAVVRVKE